MDKYEFHARQYLRIEGDPCFTPGSKRSVMYLKDAKAYFEQVLESVSEGLKATNKLKMVSIVGEFFFYLPAESIERNGRAYPLTDMKQFESVSLTEENARIWLFLKKDMFQRKIDILTQHLKLLQSAQENVESNLQLKPKLRKTFYDDVAKFIAEARDHSNFPLLLELWEGWNWSYKPKKAPLAEKTSDVGTLKKGAVLAYLYPVGTARGFYPAVVISVGKQKGKTIKVKLLDCTPRYPVCKEHQGTVSEKYLNVKSSGYIDLDCDMATNGLRDGVWRWIRMLDTMEVCLTDAQIADVQSRMKANMSASPETIEDILKKIESQQLE